MGATSEYEGGKRGKSGDFTPRSLCLSSVSRTAASAPVSSFRETNPLWIKLPRVVHTWVLPLGSFPFVSIAQECCTYLVAANPSFPPVFIPSSAFLLLCHSHHQFLALKSHFKYSFLLLDLDKLINIRTFCIALFIYYSNGEFYDLFL